MTLDEEIQYILSITDITDKHLDEVGYGDFCHVFDNPDISNLSTEDQLAFHAFMHRVYQYFEENI